ncbi:TetR/AcrR family transcriptional regulator [Nocardioides solisilvae]|uniref:TetR/AcrR family transcriptional regulator n=1 Tax=Nocardioides solisilvae TaxID=1542435 RepID=UPI0013A544F6|nr:helix-turn-helix domain-containing protein [Nocardioides solisilvae]
MSESATGSREAKRLATSRRIMRAASELTLERGLEGWTMEDLAVASDVSRRTLFNYYPAKLDAVLGPMPELSPELFAEFRAGGPTGRLAEDCKVLAQAVLAEDTFSRRDIQLQRRVILEVPRLVVTVHERFETIAGQLVEHILAREGEEFGAARARMLVRLMVSLFDSCLDSLAEEHQDRPLAELFGEALESARRLLA